MTIAAGLAGEHEAIFRRTLDHLAVRDGLFIALAVSLSFALYVLRLGFYSDDWVFLSLLHSSPDQSLTGLYQALYAGDVVIRQRPAQIVYLVLSYRLFGLSSAGYHVVNALMLTGSALLLYLVGRALNASRLLAVAVPLVYILLPHYSTDRFWLAAHQATLSLLFYSLSLYADVRALRAGPRRYAGWQVLSTLALIVSGLAYEVALPLFLLNPLIAVYGLRAKDGQPFDRPAVRKRAIGLLAANVIAVAAVVVFKAVVTVRANVETDFFAHIVGLALGAVRVNFGTYGVGLPYVIVWILSHRPDGVLIALAGVLGLTVYAYLSRMDGPSDSLFPARRAWAALVGLGLLVFALGHAVFVVSTDIWFTSASLGNRVAIAAALGVALVFVGLLGWACAWLPAPRRRRLFCGLVALLCSAGFLVNNTLASFWITAFRQQQQILHDIQAHVASLPANSTLILDGVCLELGGAYVFTGKRDLAALLSLAYDDQSLWATAITTSPRIEPAALSVFTYREWDAYPYGANLYLYNFGQKTVQRLSDYASARQYFAASGFVPERDCPPGFAWGWNAR